MRKAQASPKKLSKEAKREKLFFESKEGKVVMVPINGHWNNDSGCRLDEKA